jgi:hypothetical protein
MIASLQLPINEPSKVDSERARKYEEIRPIPSLLAQFIEKWGLLQSSSDFGKIFSAHFTVQKLPMRLRVFCCLKMNQIKYVLKELEKTKRSVPSPDFQLNSFRNGDCFKRGYALQSLWFGEVLFSRFMVWQLPMRLRVSCCI